MAAEFRRARLTGAIRLSEYQELVPVELSPGGEYPPDRGVDILSFHIQNAEFNPIGWDYRYLENIIS